MSSSRFSSNRLGFSRYPSAMFQHFVSKVLLKRFADPSSKKVGVLDLRSRELDEQTIKKVGGRQDFVVKGADKTERLWQKVEQQLPHAFKLIEQRLILDNQKFQYTIRDAIALHFTRSFAAAEIYAREYPIKRQQASDNLLAQFPAAQIVRELTGLEPPPGNVEMLARDLISRKFDARIEDHALPAELLLENYHRGRDLAATLNLEFWYATDEFLLGDLPAVSYDRDADAVGILNGVPWGNANALFMPLGPHHAVALSKDGAYIDADAHTVKWINSMQVRGAYREIYFRPGSGLGEFIANSLGNQ